MAPERFEPHDPGMTDVRRATRAVITEGVHRWTYAEQRQGEIAEFWSRERAANPTYFNGTVLLFSRFAFAGDALVATAFPTAFASYLYWRTQGFEDRTVIDGFGSAVIRSADGAVMLARQRAGNINAGLYYLPGGFIDPRDVGSGGEIDIAASIAREVGEETGLRGASLEIEPGFVVTRAGAHLSVAATLRSALGTAALRDEIMAHITADAAGELEDVVFVSSMADAAGLRLADYCKPLLPVLLARNAL